MNPHDPKVLEAYLNRDLAPGAQVEFSAHLAECLECASQVRRWRAIEQQLARTRTDWEPTDAQARRLVQKAKAGVARRAFDLRWLVAVPVALALLVIGGVWVRAGAAKPPPLVVLMAPGGQRSIPSDRVVGAVLEAPQGRLLAQLGNDRLALTRRGRVRVLRANGTETRLRLEAGTLTAEVEHRKPGASFQVETARALVRVVGTRFRVSEGDNDDLEVTVERGKVRVTFGSTVLDVGQGQKLRLDAAGPRLLPASLQEDGDLDRALDELAVPTPPDAPPAAADAGPPAEPGDDAALDAVPPPGAVPPRRRNARQVDLDPLRQKVLAGRYTEAEVALASRLRQAPRDAEAWALLGDCRRKAGQWQDAVAAYRKVIALGEPGSADRARLLAATLLQEQIHDPAAAARLLREYLQRGPGTGPLRAAATLRLARALIQLGQPEQASLLLRQVVEQGGEGPAAREATQLLRSLL